MCSRILFYLLHTIFTSDFAADTQNANNMKENPWENLEARKQPQKLIRLPAVLVDRFIHLSYGLKLNFSIL